MIKKIKEFLIRAIGGFTQKDINKAFQAGIEAREMTQLKECFDCIITHEKRKKPAWHEKVMRHFTRVE